MSITGIYTCPSCQQAITFRCSDTNIITCSHCHTCIEKREDGFLRRRTDLEPAKDDRTPIQIGTRGQWQKRHFEIIGRLRCVFAEGYANNWTMYFDDGAIMTLVESFGHFAVYEKVYLEKDIPFSQVASMEYGSGTVALNTGKNYILERQSFGQFMEAEGENWLFDDDGTFNSLEVAAQGGGRLELLDCGKGHFVNFRIHYQSFDDFTFENLRVPESGVVAKEVTCTRCNAAIPLYSWPLAQSVTCTACGACHVYEKGTWQFRRRVQLDKIPAIPLHTRGKLRGTEYQVVGFMEKQDDESYHWREYTLFNPVRGYAFLSEYNGHWIFLTEEMNTPVLNDHKTMAFLYDGLEFQLYNQYRYSLVDCRGEFPGDVFDNKNVNCREFIAPPELWARELHEHGLYWYHGTHLSDKELYAAFNDISLPYRVGVGSVQPAKGQVNTDILRSSLLGVGFAFVLLFLATVIFNRQEVIYENTIVLPDSTNIPPVVTPKFKLNKWRSNLEFEISAPVSNNWFETAITLVNADNGKEYSIEKGVEQYSGYEDGEYWTEGDGRGDVILHSIPAGNYFLQIYPAKGTGLLDNFSVKVTYDVPMWHNFFIFVMLALLPGVAVYINIFYRERMRWQNSPFYHN